MDDWPFPPEPTHKRARGSWLGRQPRLEQRPIRPRHKATFTATERQVMTYAWILAALALVALMIVALMATRRPLAPLEQLPTAPTSSAVPNPVPGSAGAVGSLPSPSPAPSLVGAP